MRSIFHPLKLLLLICFSAPLFLQGQLYSNRFGGTNASEWARSAQYDFNNGLLVSAGEMNQFTPLEAVVYQKDPCFNPINSAWYGGPNSQERFLAIRPYAHPFFGAGYVAVGTSNRNGTNDAYIVLLRPNLSVFAAWLVNGFANGDDIATAVEPTSDGGFVVVGITQTQAGDNDMFGLKFDAGLSTQWSLSYGGPGGGGNFDERALSVVENSSTGYLCIVGGTETYSISGNEDLYLLEVDMFTGNVIISGLGSHSWVIGSPFEENFNDVVYDQNNKIYHLTGRLNNGSDDDVISVVFDPNSGAVLLYDRHDGGGTEFGTSIQWDPYAGHQVIVGYENSPGFTFGSFDGFSISMPPGGNAVPGLAWHYGGGSFDGLDEIAAFDNGGNMEFFTGGGTGSFAAPAPNNFYWIYSDVTGKTGCAENPYLPTPAYVPRGVIQATDYTQWNRPRKINENANYYQNFNDILCTQTCKGATQGAVHVEIDAVVVKAYPSPAQSRLSIMADNAEGIASVRLVDINGRSLEMRESPGQGHLEFDVAGFASGVYFAEVKLANGLVKRLKWIKE